VTVFKDHFSGVAGNYARFRPVYPVELYTFILSFCDQNKIAWDAGTGNGQVAVVLAEHFDKVFASDASKEQIEHATPHPKVTYGIYPAENTTLDAGSIDFVTVGQALHWFHFEAFWQELRRVAVPGGIFACWTYSHHHFEEVVLQEALDHFFDTVEPYWPPERDFVKHGYANLPIPFTLLGEQLIPMNYQFSADTLLAYLRTWSSVQVYEKKYGSNPVTEHEQVIRLAWSKIGKSALTAIFPLTIKVFRVH
jgi:SAM-dependent methyltransferase